MDFDIAIIGSGPAGYVAAIRAGQLGKKVLIIEKDKIGGTCLNYGCIPTKALISAVSYLHLSKETEKFGINISNISYDLEKISQFKNRCVNKLTKGVELLLNKNKVEVIKDKAKLLDEHTILLENSGKNIRSEYIIIAAGCQPSTILNLEFDNKKILSSNDLLELKDIPQRLGIIGAGAVGLEIATIYKNLGSEITIFEIMPQILPEIDSEIANLLYNILQGQGIKIFTNTKIENCIIGEREIQIFTSQGEFLFDKILLAVGRKATNHIFHFPIIEVENGFIKTDKYLRTTIKNIYAIGDVRGGKLLAHKASQEGIIAVENICGNKKKIQEDIIPSSIFTFPHIGTIGLTEDQARLKFKDIKIGRFNFAANPQATCSGKTQGLVKVIATQNDEIIGLHIAGESAAELVCIGSIIIKNKLKFNKLKDVIISHPTFSEAIKEAILDIKSQAIHK